MNVRTKILAVLLAAGGIAMAVPLATQAHPMGGQGGCERSHAMKGERDGLPRMLKRLDLSAEQKDKISALRKQDAGILAEKFKTLRDNRAQLGDMRMKGEYDEAKIKMLTEQGAQTMAEIAQLRARQMHEIQQLLTPEQRQQVEAKRERMQKHWQERQDTRHDRG